MERRVRLHALVQNNAESPCIDTMREAHPPEISPGSSAGSAAGAEGQAVMQQASEQGKSLEFLQASEFVSLIKEHFPRDRDILKRFLDILESYYSEKKSVQVVYREAASLFNGHERLLRLLPHFMPDQEQGRQG